jgi:hypothetical protein
MSSQLFDAGRRRSPVTLPGHDAGRAPRNKGDGLPSRSADGRRNRRRDASNTPRSSRAAAPWVDRSVVARSASDPGSAHADRERPRPASRVDSRSEREGQQASGGRDRRLGVERSSRSVARLPSGTARWPVVLRDRRTDSRAAVVGDRRAREAAPVRHDDWCQAPVRDAPICRPHRYADQTRRGAAKRQLSGPKPRHNLAPFRGPAGRPMRGSKDRQLRPA